MKKIIYIVLFYSAFISNSFSAPDVNCEGLPFCELDNELIGDYVGSTIVAEMIKYVAVIAVISVMISGIMYLISGGEEEKVKKAKTWIIYSLVGTLLSVSAWAIISTVNEILIK